MWDISGWEPAVIYKLLKRVGKTLFREGRAGKEIQSAFLSKQSNENIITPPVHLWALLPNIRPSDGAFTGWNTVACHLKALWLFNARICHQTQLTLLGFCCFILNSMLVMCASGFSPFLRQNLTDIKCIEMHTVNQPRWEEDSGMLTFAVYICSCRIYKYCIRLAKILHSDQNQEANS